VKYKMVLVDMDGTLLNDEKNISDEDVQVLKALQEIGVIIGIATGRRYSFAKAVIERYGLDAVFFSNNGNAIWEMSTDTLIDSTTIRKECLLDILKMGYEKDMHPVLHANYNGYELICEYDASYPGYNGYVSPSTTNLLVIDDFALLPDSHVMIMCYTGNMEKVQELKDRIDEKYPDEIHTHITMSLKRIGPLLEVSHIEGTKWHAALKYAERCGIKQEEIIAIGDDSNDLEMIRYAGLGIAMKNALDFVKPMADLVTEYDNNQSGVGRVLKKVFAEELANILNE
jgi:Cof subfamily protein (haloacid dehalogenase superfamily)